MPLKITAAVRAGEELVPSACRNQYFAYTLDRGLMFACLMGMAHLGSFPKTEAALEQERLKTLMKFGDGKIHTAAHGITKRLYAQFPELGKSIKHYPKLYRDGPIKVPRDRLQKMSLFQYCTDLFDASGRTIDECCKVLERAGL